MLILDAFLLATRLSTGLAEIAFEMATLPFSWWPRAPAAKPEPPLEVKTRIAERLDPLIDRTNEILRGLWTEFVADPQITARGKIVVLFYRKPESQKAVDLSPLHSLDETIDTLHATVAEMEWPIVLVVNSDKSVGYVFRT